MAIATRWKSLFGLDQENEASPEDRRTDPRQKVLLKADAFPVEGYAEVTVKNISKTGLSGETDAALEVDAPLLFCIEGNEFHLGLVRWVRGRKFGLDLDNALGIFGLENEIDHGFLPTHRPRPRRYDVDVTGRIALTPRLHRITVRDVSRSGLCLEAPLSLAAHQQVIVRLRNRPLMLASVQWTAGGKVGVKTAERIETLRLVYAYE